MEYEKSFTPETVTLADVNEVVSELDKLRERLQIRVTEVGNQINRLQIEAARLFGILQTINSTSLSELNGLLDTPESINTYFDAEAEVSRSSAGSAGSL